MKTYKKLRLGLLLAAAVAVLSLILTHGQAAAATTYTAAWVDRSNILVTGSDGTSITLTDGQWDHNWDYTANWPSDGCQVEINGFGSSQIVGITQRNGNPPWNATASQAKLTVQHIQGTSCAPVAGYNNANISIDNPQNAQIMFAWIDSGTIGRVDQNTNFTFSNPQKQADGSTWFTRTSEAGATKCRDTLVVNAASTSATLYELNNSDPGTGQKAPTSIDPTGTCYLQWTVSYIVLLGAKSDDADSAVPSGVAFPLGGQSNAAKPPGTGTTGGTASGNQPDTCELKSNGWSFAWLMCPLLEAAQEITDFSINTFEQQLSFTVNQNLGDQNSQASVEQTWSLIKNLATALLVVIMLIMVISQAVGEGPFDAYTVRKMLPRLVAVAIAIQLSWALVSWIIDVFDDLGRGLADIMYFSFHGANNMELGQLLAHAHINTAAGATISWVGLMAVIGLSIAALPAVLVFALVAIAGAATALIVLILRKVLIIALLIFAPIAFLSYVLPGTQRYWKLWRDNFIKILAMFPLVVILIAGGRIFAYIIGTQNNSVLLSFIFILVGFFGPLFFLPKTFRWGGQALAFAADGVSKATERFAGKESALGKGAQGWAERRQGQAAKQYNPLGNWGSRTIRRIQSGHMIPFSERSRRLTIATGEKWANERNEEAQAYVQRSQEKALIGYDAAMTDEDGNFISGIHRNAKGQMIDRDNNVVRLRRDAWVDYRGNDINQAETEHMTGVEAGKQALLDIAGNSGTSVTDRRAAQAAIKQLIDTHSEIELQGSRISRKGLKQDNAYVGRRVSEVPLWQDTITNSPPHYSAINSTRPDLAPDLIQSAEGRAGDTYNAAYADANEANRAARVRAIDAQRLNIALERMTPEALQSAHYGLFQDIARMGDQVVRVTDPVTGARTEMTLSQQLGNTIQRFNESGSTVGVNAVGSLRGGKEIHVNAALAADGSGRTLNDVASPRGGGGPAPAGP